MQRDMAAYPSLEPVKLREIYLKIYAGAVYNNPDALKG